MYAAGPAGVRLGNRWARLWKGVPGRALFGRGWEPVVCMQALGDAQ